MTHDGRQALVRLLVLRPGDAVRLMSGPRRKLVGVATDDDAAAMEVLELRAGSAGPSAARARLAPSWIALSGGGEMGAV